MTVAIYNSLSLYYILQKYQSIVTVVISMMVPRNWSRWANLAVIDGPRLHLE